MDLLSVAGSQYVVRRAVADDLPAIVGLLADDDLGAKRESSDPGEYADAFAAINRDDHQFLAVVEDEVRQIVGTMQLTVIPGLSLCGATRLQIEAVRVASQLRGSGVGKAVIGWAHDYGREHGARTAQLTSDASRVDAHRFYRNLGYEPSHVGFKLPL